jgi:hypothetical protein
MEILVQTILRFLVRQSPWCFAGSSSFSLSRITLPAVLVFAITIPSAAQNLLTDGGFENPVAQNPFTTYDAPGKMGAWNLVDTGDRTNNGTGKSGVDLVRNYWQPHGGDQSIDLNGWAKGEIYQSLAAKADACHTLTFYTAGNTDAGPVVKSVAVYWLTQDTALRPMPGNLAGVFTFDTTGRSKQNMGWTQQSVSGFRGGPDKRSILVFQSLDAGSYGMALDDITVTPQAAGVRRSIMFDAVDVRRNPATGNTYDLLAFPVGNGPFQTFVNAIGKNSIKIAQATTVNGRREFSADFAPLGDIGGGPIDAAFAAQISQKRPFKSSGYRFGSFFDIQINQPLIGFRLWVTCGGDSWDVNASSGGNAFRMALNPADNNELDFTGGNIGRPDADGVGTWLWIQAPRTGFGALEGQAQFLNRR